jgi:hypothetical protein
MMPLNARVQRFLPFGLPALLALVTFYAFQSSGDESDARSARATLQKGSSAENPTGSSKTADLFNQGAFDAVSVQLPVDPPANEQVIELLARFQESDGLFSQKVVRELAEREIGKQVIVRGAGMEIPGVVDSRLETEGSLHIGIKLDDDLGRFQLSVREDDKVKASLMFTGESHAFSFDGLAQNGAWKMKATSVDHILCAPGGSTYPVARGQMAMPKVESPKGNGKAPQGPLGAPPVLSSNPSSTFVVYCDFDGEVVTHPLWNDGNTINAAPHAKANDVAFVTRVWERVSEDFAPFNLNVTTDRTVYDATAESRRVMCVITPTNLAAPGAGGVAYVGSFGFGIPCWAFNDTEATCAETISHEVGHTMGLRHDGVTGGFAYYGGHGAGPTSWAPIMGAYFADFNPPFIDEELTQFSRGEYPTADNKEDDLAIITGSNGFTYRQDDKGSSIQDASQLSLNRGTIEDSGIIEKTADKDYFAFATSGGAVSMKVSVTNVNSTDDPQRGSNLAVSAEILDSTGKSVLIANPADEIDATITTTLARGNYFLVVDGAGRGDLATGFSDYASLGQYSISGTVPQNGILTISPSSLDLPRQGGEGTFEISSNSNWTWSTDQDWVQTSEATQQRGNQVFDYTVSRNLGKASRTASIRLTDGTFTAVHTINQEGSVGDDHGDRIEEATLVGQNSTTPGVLEVEEDIDVFRVEVQGFGTLKVRTTGGTDTYGELLDAYGTRIVANDNKRSPNFELSSQVGTGIYYISVRHAHEGGFGPYDLVCSFQAGPVLIIDPAKRLVGPDGGKFVVRVSSNESWTWASDSRWVVVENQKKSQTAGQVLAYEVKPNNSTVARKAVVTFKSGNLTMTHEIEQSASGSDDHGNAPGSAGVLAQNGKAFGKIDFEGDEDLFKVVLQTSGQLQVTSSGSTKPKGVRPMDDSYGQLLDSNLSVLVSQDSGNGDNFVISRAVGAGVYYVRVRHFSSMTSGQSYSLASSFTPSSLVDVRYSATTGGIINGPMVQKIRMSGEARPVTAVPSPGYSFHSWSDGRKNPSRRDRGVSTHLDLTARFVRTLSVKDSSGAWVQDNQIPPVDFGSVAAGKARKLVFKITNNGSRTLTGLRVAESGAQTEAWSSSELRVKDLKPGKSTNLEITLKSPEIGFKSATFLIASVGANMPFRLQVMGFVDEPVFLAAKAKAGLKSAASVSASVDAARSGVLAAQASSDKAGSSSQSSAWVTVSSDGLLRYRFFRKGQGDLEPQLWLTSNGTDWSEALVLNFRKVKSGNVFVEYEALVIPPLLNSSIYLVSESKPANTDP